MTLTIITGIVSLLGIIGTIVAWRYNPRRRIYEEIDQIYAQLDKLYQKRDEAILNKNTDALTVFTRDIVRLCDRKNALLQRK